MLKMSFTLSFPFYTLGYILGWIYYAIITGFKEADLASNKNPFENGATND